MVVRLIGDVDRSSGRPGERIATASARRFSRWHRRATMEDSVASHGLDAGSRYASGKMVPPDSAKPLLEAQSSAPATGLS